MLKCTIQHQYKKFDVRQMLENKLKILANNYPDNSECILDEEVEDEGDDTDEGEDGDPGALPGLRLVQLLASHGPAQPLMRTGRTTDLTVLQNIVP